MRAFCSHGTHGYKKRRSTARRKCCRHFSDSFTRPNIHLVGIQESAPYTKHTSSLRRSNRRRQPSLCFRRRSSGCFRRPSIHAARIRGCIWQMGLAMLGRRPRPITSSSDQSKRCRQRSLELIKILANIRPRCAATLERRFRSLHSSAAARNSTQDSSGIGEQHQRRSSACFVVSRKPKRKKKFHKTIKRNKSSHSSSKSSNTRSRTRSTSSKSSSRSRNRSNASMKPKVSPRLVGYL